VPSKLFSKKHRPKVGVFYFLLYLKKGVVFKNEAVHSMIKSTSTLGLGKKTLTISGLVLMRHDKFIPDSEYRHSIVVKTRIGSQLIVVDLRNKVFPLDLKTIIDETGIYLAVFNFDLFMQPHGLFLTSQKRMACPKYDEPPGIRLAGQCRRVFSPQGDLFTFSGFPATVSLN